MSAASRPTAGPARPYHFPPFQRGALSNGLQVVTSRVPKLPLVTLSIVVDAGAARDPEQFDGLAVLTAKLLPEGTTRRDGAALADAFEQLGASVDVRADWDSATVQLTVLADRMEAALHLLAEVMLQPTFPAREVARLKAERQAALLQMRADPRELADESFAQELYAQYARYSRPIAGGAAAVERINQQIVQEFYGRHYVPQRTTIIAVGDLSHEHGLVLMESAFGSWQGTSNAEVRSIDVVGATRRRIRVITKSDAPQSELRVGHRGVPRSHKDHFALVVMNAVLGGLFSSRINLNLREAHAYTYGAHSTFDWRRDAGPFVVSTAVESGVTAEATREVVREIERIRQDVVTAEELSLAQSYLAGVFPIRYETTTAISDALAALVTYAYPEDYYDTYRGRILSINREEIRQVAQEHLKPESLLILAVGDPAAISAPLAALELGDVLVRSVQESQTGG